MRSTLGIAALMAGLAGLLPSPALVSPQTLAASQPAETTAVPLEFEVAGLRVILLRRQSPTNVIAVDLYLLGGSRQITQKNAGIEPFLLMASAYGTGKYPGEAARRALARTGSSIAISAEADWTTYTLHGIRHEFDSTWAVFADRLMNPTLDSSAMAVVRARMLASIARRTESPQDQVAFLAESLAFRDHPYATNPWGTHASIKSLTADDLRGYARDQLITSRMLLVVVGDISQEQLSQAVTRTLAKLPRGEYRWSLPPPWRPAKPEIVAVQRALPTNYIMGYMSGPLRSSAEYPAFERAMSLLGHWVADEVREKGGLSYAASVAVLERGAPGAAIYVSTTSPADAVSTVNLVILIYENFVSIPEGKLRRAAKSYNTAYLYATETAASYADLLARAYLYDGDVRAASRRAEIMGKVSFRDLRRMIREYARNIQYAYVGDTAALPRAQMGNR